MSDVPGGGDAAEEFDLGEIEEGQDGEDGATDEGGAADDAEDAGNDAADGEDEAEAGEGEDVGEPPPRQQRAGRKTQAQRLRERLAKAEQEAAELRGYREAASQFRQQPPQVDPAAAARAAQEEQERLAMMSPVEVGNYYYQKAQAEHQQSLNHMRFQMADALDKQGYDARAVSSALHQRYRERVEQTIAGARARGNYDLSREQILTFLVGEDARKRAERAAPGQRRDARRRVNGQQTRPGGARSDSGRGQRHAPGTPEGDDALVEEYFRQGGRL